MAIFILQLMIPIILYFQLIAQNVYPIVLTIIGHSNQQISTDIDFKDFPSYTYICIIIMGVLIALTLISKLDLFVKISTYSVIFVFLTLIFLVTIGIYSLGNTNFIFSDSPILPGQKDPWEIKLFRRNVGPLLGILCGAFYLHNITLPIVRNAKNP